MSDAHAHEHEEHRHEHGHDHGDHGHTHTGHDHNHGPAALPRLARLRHSAAHLITPHSHDSADRTDSAMEASAEGMRTLWLSQIGRAHV